MGVDVHTLLRWKERGHLRVLRREAFDQLLSLASREAARSGS